jgi:nicotinate-nucleotide adenylyltransferase
MKIGLFFGSFNPIHNGHLAIARYFAYSTDLDQVWFVVSPQNPLKDKNNLIDNVLRFEMVKIAIDKESKFIASDIEFGMPVPSYTIDTLNLLEREYPDDTFIILMGSDGLETFDQWKNYKKLIQRFTRYIYPREDYVVDNLNEIDNAKFYKAPKFDISSTKIRESVASGSDVKSLLPDKVYEFIKDKGLYSSSV